MQQALANFETSLDRIRDVATNTAKNAKRALQNPKVLARHNTVLSSVLVTLSGFLESFLREVAEEYADSICKQQQPFTSLKKQIQETHFHEGGKFMHALGAKRSAARYTWTSADVADIARRLASVNSGANYELVWEAFADTGQNPDSDVIGQFLRRFGVKEPILTLAAQMPNMTPQRLSLQLQSLMAIRNECAHTGAVSTPPTGVDVSDHCDFLEALAKAIVSTLSAHQVC